MEYNDTWDSRKSGGIPGSVTCHRAIMKEMPAAIYLKQTNYGLLLTYEQYNTLLCVFNTSINILSS